MKKKILYVEDDNTLAFLTADNLEQEYEVAHYDNGKAAFEAFKQDDFDLCILDVMLPEMDGFELATAIRERDVEVPIIFLSAKTLKEDRIKGLRLGADDYLVKPYSMEELVLKIEVFLQRSQKKPAVKSSTFTIGDFVFDAVNYAITRNDKTTKLTERESALLQLFIEHKNTVLKREVILTSIWGTDDYFMGRSMDVFISRLRKIFKDDDRIRIENIPRVGFKLVAPD
ncbi:response regulator transcription factor [Flavobacterium salilacus subsp. salilacus]|uniref:response regulator transcription factor n=1 Tax=Flavobacterium TaxID=237 RepID=UPI001074E0F9|nr:MULTISPECIES: response regulator transcription factor [Flavobacterium]KAF2518923.1 response regulator transcription factor [Flavobacterium salilacus subsp. salilacus]MBE1614915.1 response regulator transcription factor [Flavobacterium sp. SaA2.13]